MKDRDNDSTSAPDHFISIHLDELLTERNMSLAELGRRVGITVANLSILKNGRAKAIRFNTLSAICRELDCTPGDIITYRDNNL